MTAEMTEITEKLEEIRKYVEYLKKYQKHSLADLKKDFTLRGAVERYMHLCIEAVLNVGDMVILLEGLKKPDTYKDVILTLGERGILPKAFANRFAPVAGFRNILVHRYTQLDIKELHRHLQEDLDDFMIFAEAIAKHVKRKNLK